MIDHRIPLLFLPQFNRHETEDRVIGGWTNRQLGGWADVKPGSLFCRVQSKQNKNYKAFTIRARFVEYTLITECVLKHFIPALSITD